MVTRDNFEISSIDGDTGRVVLRELRPAAVAIVLFYLFYALSSVFRFAGETRWFLLITAGVVIGVSLAVRIAMGRGLIPSRAGNAVGVGLGLLMMSDILATMWYLGDPFFNYYLMIVVVGVSYFVLSPRWWLVGMAVYLVTWVPVSIAMSTAERFPEYVFVMMSAVLLSGTIQLARVRNHRRIERLRAREREQLVRIEDTLAAAEREIEERQRAEREKRDLEEQLRQTQKMEAIGRLAGGVAHDMNNVLGAISSSAFILDAEVEESAGIRPDVDNIITACNKGRSLTRDLLGFARKGKYVVRELSLNQIALQIKGLLARTFSKGIEIELRLDENLHLVQGDTDQLEHALMNVCINAADAMESGGKILITSRNVDPRKGDDQARVELSVADDGVGMSDEIRHRVFEPFFTTKPKGKGTGLGLSMVYGAIQNHGGSVGVDSRVGEGTTVSFVLPAVDDTGEKKTAEEGIIDDGILGGGCVLVVDDETIVRVSSRRMLEHLGYSVYLADSGETALDIFEQKRDEISLVILDQLMPVMDGHQTFSGLKEIDPEVKVLVASGYSRDEKVESMLANGAIGFMEKPLEFRTLAHYLAQVAV